MITLSRASTAVLALLGWLGWAGAAGAQTDIRFVADGHVWSVIKSAVYDFSPAVVSKGDSDYPSGHLVVIPVEAPDTPRNDYVTPGSTLVQLFGLSGSPAVYYKVTSGGAFTLQGHVSDWATIATPLKDYKSVSDGKGSPYYASEHPEFMQAVLAAGSVNWKQLDANNDGKISRGEATILLLIPNRDGSWEDGDPGGWASNVGQTIGKVKTSAGSFDFGSRPVIYLSVTEAALKYSTGIKFIDNVPTVAHELLHAFFDLPDRYGAEGINGTGHTGPYCLLSNSSSWTILNPHDRMKLGWIRPPILTPDHANVWLQAPSAAATQAALILLDPARPDEYWLVENRYRSGSGSTFESGLPGEGLAVWWVRSRALTNQSDDVRLVAASAADQDPDGKGIHPDNSLPLDATAAGYYNQGSQDLFGEQDGPRTLRYSDGTPSKFGLYRISRHGATVTLWIGTAPPPPDPVVTFQPDASPQRAAPRRTLGRLAPQTRPAKPPPPEPQPDPALRRLEVRYETVSPVATPRLELQDGSALVARREGRTRYWVRVDRRGRTVTTFDPRTNVVRSPTGEIAVVAEPGEPPRLLGHATDVAPVSGTPRLTR